MFNHRFSSFVFCFAAAGLSLAAVTPSHAETRRVVVDLDLDELGLLDGGAQSLELEIRCSGATPHHQVRMEGDVLVVRTEPMAGGTAILDTPSLSGVNIRFDQAPPQAPGAIESALVIEPKPVTLPVPELAPVLEQTPTAPVPAPAPPPAPALSAEEEVLAAMQAAMAEARAEGAARLDEARRTSSTSDGWSAEINAGSSGGWTTEVKGERVD